METDENKAIVRRYLEEAWGAGNLAVVDELIAPDTVHEYFREYPPGPEGFKLSISGPRATFPDLRVEITDIVAEGDTVMARYLWHGTDTGGFPGHIATGRTITIPGMDLYRIADGTIVGYRTVIDELALR